MVWLVSSIKLDDMPREHPWRGGSNRKPEQRKRSQIMKASLADETSGKLCALGTTAHCTCAVGLMCSGSLVRGPFSGLWPGLWRVHGLGWSCSSESGPLLRAGSCSLGLPGTAVETGQGGEGLWSNSAMPSKMRRSIFPGSGVLAPVVLL